MNGKRKRMMTIVGILIAVLVLTLLVIALISPASLTSSTTSATSSSSASSFSNSSFSANSSSADYQFFVQPNLARIESLRQWLMSPPNMANNKIGYDASFGMERGGFWGGGFQNGFVLIDTQLILAKPLDYLNALKGTPTSIETHLDQWLSNTTFVNPSTGESGKYLGNDRREILFGKVLNCVMDDSGQTFYAPGHTLSDSIPITTALTNSYGCTSQNGAMNTFALWIELYYLQGNTQQALSMFQQTLNAWNPTLGTGVGGTTGGYFPGNMGSGPNAGTGRCEHSRTLGYWIHMVRATGFWDLNNQTRTIAKEAVNEFWSHQLSDGGIGVNYPNCGNGSKESGESSGLGIVAFDPRVPVWFSVHSGASASGASLTNQSSSVQSIAASVSSLFMAVLPQESAFLGLNPRRTKLDTSNSKISFCQ